jgi:DNA invertase Pin-like site-specific DNA recombinase
MSQIIGYARVSTEDQKVDLQQDALRTAGCTDIYVDKLSGKDMKRPELENCLRSLRAGDTLVVWKLDRLGRSMTDLIRTVTDLEKKGISFLCIQDDFDTTKPTGKLLFHFMAALAEFERSLIRERTIAGMAAARARGRLGGRRQKLSEKQQSAVRAALADKTTDVTELAKTYGVCRSTLYSIAKTPKISKPQSTERT